jgi:hypothetical protein
MKKLAFILALVTGCFTYEATAQVSVNFNVGSQPLWGPVGYDRVDYYYVPDIDAYYYVPKKQFIYLDGPNWIFTPGLPGRFKSYDLYRGYKVVINDPTPYLHHDVYKKKYWHYRGNSGQAFIRDSHDEKYFVVKGHPQYGKGKSNGNGNGKGNGNGNGKGNGKSNGKKDH